MTKLLVSVGGAAGLVDLPNVLRDIPLHELPHTLLRRGAMPSAPVVADPAMDTSVPTEVVNLHDQELQRGYAIGIETGMREGKAQGYSQGHELGYQQGTEKGYRDGLKQGQEQAQEAQEAARKDQADFRDRSSRLGEIIGGVSQDIAIRLAEAEDDMVALCFDVVCRIAGKELATAAGVRQHLLHALRDFKLRAALKVHMHPDDLALLRHEQLPKNSIDVELERMGYNQVQWVPDTDIAMGGCILKSSEGGLDARLQTQLESLRSVFVEVRNGRQLTMCGVLDNAPASALRETTGPSSSDNRGES